jgi:hypothetical protein
MANPGGSVGLGGPQLALHAIHDAGSYVAEPVAAEPSTQMLLADPPVHIARIR